MLAIIFQVFKLLQWGLERDIQRHCRMMKHVHNQNIRQITAGQQRRRALLAEADAVEANYLANDAAAGRQRDALLAQRQRCESLASKIKSLQE